MVTHNLIPLVQVTGMSSMSLTTHRVVAGTLGLSYTWHLGLSYTWHTGLGSNKTDLYMTVYPTLLCAGPA